MKKHPGFKAVAGGMAAKQGISKERASAELGSSTRKTSPAARKSNPRLSNVKRPAKKPSSGDLHSRLMGSKGEY